MNHLRFTDFCLLFTISLSGFAYQTSRWCLRPVQDQLIDYYNIHTVEYTILQSFYSWPNIVSCIICGILINRIGLNKMFIASYLINMVGLFLMIISVIKIDYIYLCISRVIVGISNESLRISLNIYLVSNFNANRHGIVLSIFVASLAISSAINASLIYQIYLFVNKSMILTLSYPLFVNILSSIILYSWFKIRKYQQCKLEESELLQHVKLTKYDTKKFNILQITSFSKTYWLLILSGALWTTSAISWANIRISFLHHMYGYDYSLSTTLATIGNIMGMVITLIFGTVFDKYGHRGKILIIGNILYILSQYLLGWVHINLVFTIFTLFIFYLGYSAINANVWTCITVIIEDKNKLGTAYGLYISLIFLTNSIGFLMVGVFTNDDAESGSNMYLNVQLFVIGLALISIILMFIMYIMQFFYQKNKLELKIRGDEYDT